MKSASERTGSSESMSIVAAITSACVGIHSAIALLLLVFVYGELRCLRQYYLLFSFCQIRHRYFDDDEPRDAFRAMAMRDSCRNPEPIALLENHLLAAFACLRLELVFVFRPVGLLPMPRTDEGASADKRNFSLKTLPQIPFVLVRLGVVRHIFVFQNVERQGMYSGNGLE